MLWQSSDRENLLRIRDGGAKARWEALHMRLSWHTLLLEPKTGRFESIAQSSKMTVIFHLGSLLVSVVVQPFNLQILQL